MSDRRKITLEEYVRKKTHGRISHKELLKVYEEFTTGKLRIRDPQPPRDLIEYVLRPDYALWYWTVLTILGLTVLTIFTTDSVPGALYLRYIVGSLTVLFLPGYVTIEALYPREKDLEPLERLALSIGLSLALVPLIGLVLNYTPWGIRLEPIIASLTIYILMIGFIACFRKYQVLSQH